VVSLGIARDRVATYVSIQVLIQYCSSVLGWLRWLFSIRTVRCAVVVHWLWIEPGTYVRTLVGLQVSEKSDLRVLSTYSTIYMDLHNTAQVKYEKLALLDELSILELVY
jgi:hypothetical protein